MMLLKRFGSCVSSGCCQPRHDAAVTAMLRYGSWVWWRHDAVNIRMMLIFITLSQDDLRLWYHHES